jgi:hypothetical protein
VLTSSAPLHEARVKAGAVLEKRESLSRARSRRRSAELPRRVIAASSSPAATKGRLMRRQAEKQLRTGDTAADGDHVRTGAGRGRASKAVSPTPPASLRSRGGQRRAIDSGARQSRPCRCDRRRRVCRRR